MDAALKSLRQILLTMLVLLAAAWTSAECAQQLLRWHAEHLLTDIRTLEVNRSNWSDAQAVMNKWSRYSVPTGPCSAESCNYQISFAQTLPQLLVGNPVPTAANRLPRLVDHLGLRSEAARGGFTIKNGIVITKWFGEQLTLPVQDWHLPSDYIPYLSVSSVESAGFHQRTAGQPLRHPNRMVLISGQNMEARFAPDEDPAERATLMDFRFNCLTQLTPCLTEAAILPEAWAMAQEH